MKKLSLIISFLVCIFSAQAQTADRITYTVTGTGFSTTEETAVTLEQEVVTNVVYSNPVGTFDPVFIFNFTKASDINSKSLNQAADMGTKLTSIEFKIYAAGAATPYMSYQLKNFLLIRFKQGGAAGGGPVIENISLLFENYGFKDWLNNVSFGYSTVTRQITPY